MFDPDWLNDLRVTLTFQLALLTFSLGVGLLVGLPYYSLAEKFGGLEKRRF